MSENTSEQPEVDPLGDDQKQNTIDDGTDGTAGPDESSGQSVERERADVNRGTASGSGGDQDAEPPTPSGEEPEQLGRNSESASDLDPPPRQD